MVKIEETQPADMQKTSTYFRTIVAFHNLRDRARETAESWQERGLSDRLHDGWNNTTQAVTAKTKNFFTHPEDVHCEYIPEKYNYVFRPKSRLELILLSGTVCGIEFCYAAETAFVTPILLSLGLSIKFVTMIWCLSPLIGLFLTPILGSMSDSCESKWGRRRPFIIMYSIGIILGLLLVPNGQHIGLALGDKPFDGGLSTDYPKIMLNGTSENAPKLNQVHDLNRDVLNKFYSQDFDDPSKDGMIHSTDKNVVRNKRSSFETDEETAVRRNTLLATGKIKDDFQNINAMPIEDEMENTDVYKDTFFNSVDEFSDLIEKDGTFPEAKQYGIKASSSRNKYPRETDGVDIYPSLQFGGMNTGDLNKVSENNNKYTELQKSSMLEDEFSKLVNKENNDVNELPLRHKTVYRYSRRIDDDDIHPNLRFGKINAINPNIESENGKYIQKQKSEFPQPTNSIKGFSNDMPIQTSSAATQIKNAHRYVHSEETDEEDVYPKFPRVQRGELNLPEIQASQEKPSKLALSPGITKSSERELNNDKKESKPSVINKQNIPTFPDDTYATSHIQTWSVIFTVIGTVLLDFCSDACQSPSRTYLLDVTIPSDHAAGLSTFTVMAGFGGSIGYAMGALHWERTYIGQLLGGQVNTVFLIVTVIFILCLVTTVTSFPEIPLSILKDPKMYKEYKEKFQNDFCPSGGDELKRINNKPKHYGSTDEDHKVDKSEMTSIGGPDAQNAEKPIENETTNHLKSKEKDSYESISDDADNPLATISTGVAVDVADELKCANEHPTLKEYLISIIHMPNSLRVLCLTNLFCWMSLVCYSLYFTDFVGESVFGGDPQAPEDSASLLSYQNGVQFGCWGMALYSISCSIYSLFIESLVKKVGAKLVYIGGQLVYSVGMVIMAITRHKVAVILLSPTAGIMYSTLFTMPYLLIAHYHCNNQFSDGKKGSGNNTRGIGTDVAAVSSMVFLSQFILSLSMGSIVEAIGSSVVPVCAAALLSACGAISATQVTYLDI